MRATLTSVVAILVAAAVWVPMLAWWYRADARPVFDLARSTPQAEALAEQQLSVWRDPASKRAALEALRRSNAEWDFMGRTFLVAGTVNLALRDPRRRDEVLALVDAVLEETLALEASQGQAVFLMAYLHDRPFVRPQASSLFIDSELALMIAHRRLLADSPRWKEALRVRVRRMEAQMRDSPLLSAESYPDECWVFDNATALAAMRMADALDGTDHRALAQQWIRTARHRLIDPKTGLLVSSFTYAGETKDGPEGSTLWMAIHALHFVDPDFAREQYALAKRELFHTIAGFGLAREWPLSRQGAQDIDSGLTIPFVDAGPASSGMALIAASALEDPDTLSRLLASLEYAGFPVRQDGRLRYAASNGVGDAVLLYALTLGPAERAFAKVGRRGTAGRSAP